MVECKANLACACTTCPGCEESALICDTCEGESHDVMLFCEDGMKQGAKRGEPRKGEL